MMKPFEINTLLDSTHEALIAAGHNGRITVFNKAAQTLSGIPADRVMGLPARDVLERARLHLVLETGQPELDQVELFGTTTVVTNRVPIRNRHGEIVGAVAVLRQAGDIDRLASELVSLKETQTLLEAIINSTQDSISVVDANGIKILINPAYTRLTGMTAEDVLNKPATVDIAEGESMHMRVLATGLPVKHTPMKLGIGRREVLVDAAPIIVDGILKGSVAVIHDVSELRRLSDELNRAHQLIRHLDSKYAFEDIIGLSPAITEVVEQAKQAAETSATVLLTGESGTGKELFAHAIHHAGSRANGPFVRVNCGAISDTLLESELFGYVEGAFTGARRGGSKGHFLEAQGGTIFLDEIGESNAAVQTRLLRVLQEREIVPVGASRPIPVDVRVIAATNINLSAMVKSGVFRADLFYRLNVLLIQIPPLRERKEDIPLILDFLLTKLNKEYGRHVKGITPQALQLFQSYDWPGNVRELENMLGRAIIKMRPGEKIVAETHVPRLTTDSSSSALAEGLVPEQLVSGLSDLAAARSVCERELIINTMAATRSNRTKAAALLKISVRQLFNKLKKYKIE